MADGQGIKNFLSSALQTGVDKVQSATGQKSGNSTFYPTTLNAQKNIKCGWLKKQGGVVKSWKKRWFALKGDRLYYFLSQDESKPPQGVIPLPGNNVVEVAMNTSKPEEYLFEIVPGGDKAKLTTTHDTYLICAADDDERKAWVQVIRKVMFSKIGGAIFGQTLEETLAFEQTRKGQRKIPELMESCVEFLMNYGLDVEGIFRLPGRTSLIRELREKFDKGERPDLDCEQHDVQTVASLLKLFLRELPEPLIPISKYEVIMHQVNRELHLNPDKAVEQIAETLKDIKPAYYNLLQYLCKFLYEVAQHSDVNKMTEINLATVFVHSFIRPEDEDPTLLMATANSRTQTTFILINKHKEIFTIEYTPQGSIVAVDNLLDIGNVQCEDKPFDANEGAVYMSGKELTTAQGFYADDMLGDLPFTANHSVENNNLPQPLFPESKNEENVANKKGTRRGRFFNDYLDKRNSGESDDDDDDAYTEIDNAGYPLKSPTGSNNNDMKSSGDYSVAGNDNYCLQASSNSVNDEVDGYSSIADQKVVLRRKPVESRVQCESIVSIDDDYSVLTDYTSLLREKSSQMYKEDGDDNEAVPPVQPASDSPEEVYRKVVKRSPLKQNGETGNGDSESKKESVPPVPKRPPVPSPRRSIKAQSVFVDKSDSRYNDGQTKTLLKAQSVDVVCSNLEEFRHEGSLNNKPRFKDSSSSVSSSQGGSVKSNNSDYQSLEELISVDLADASYAELLSHIESLRNELLDCNEKISSTKKKHKKTVQEMAEKIDQERTSTQGAVEKVMQLQRTIQVYQMKFGSIHE